MQDAKCKIILTTSHKNTLRRVYLRMVASYIKSKIDFKCRWEQGKQESESAPYNSQIVKLILSVDESKAIIRLFWTREFCAKQESECAAYNSQIVKLILKRRLQGKQGAECAA